MENTLNDNHTHRDNRHGTIADYGVGEEIGNAVTHGIGAALSIAALPVCIVTAVSHGHPCGLAGAIIYPLAMFLEYLMSTLYHALRPEKAKRVFKVLDHSSIYLMIAGCYTPICLIALLDSGGIWLCITVWALALIGIAFEAFWTYRPRWISTVIYLLLGWCVIWFIPTLWELLDPVGFWLLVAGGLCYSVGCIFYVLKKVPYMHMVFHIWVLAGSVCQFLCIVLYVL